MATGNVTPTEREDTPKERFYQPKDDEKKIFEEYKRRKSELMDSRKNISGINIDEKMRVYDQKYFSTQADIPASELDPNQKPVAINNAFGKVTTALGLLIDRNPDFELEEDNPKYSANRELLKQLAKKSFRNTNSLGQLKLSIFNMARRGWFIGRTFNRRLEHQAKFLVGVDKNGKKKYEEKTVTKMDDVFYMNLSNYNAWLDEETRPEDFFSTRDWMWREVWHIDKVKAMFPEAEFPNMKYVSAGGDTSEIPDYNSTDGNQAGSDSSAKETKEYLTELFFYENQYEDLFIVEVNGIMVVYEPLPQDHKRLSVVYGTWHLRNDDNIYGISIIEEMEQDENLANRIINMGMRQLLLTIAPPGFYTGTEDPEDENMKITPGVLRRTLDPKNITWMEIPQGNKDWMEINQWLETKQDDKTGINDALEGSPATGGTDTAFELGINREAALKRLRVPLRSLQTALDWEFQNRIALIQQVYADYKVEHLSSKEEIQAYLDEVKADPEFYYIENEGEADKEVFYAKRYRTVKLGLDQDDKGNYVDSEEEKFFHIKPEMLAFQGNIRTDISSLLVNSEELEKADTLRLSNIILPMITTSTPEVAGPSVKQILHVFNKDPKKWLPDAWLLALNLREPTAEDKAKAQKEKQMSDPTQGVPSPELGDPTGGLPTMPKPATVVPPSDLKSMPSASAQMGAISR